MNPMAMRWGRLYMQTPAEKALEPAIAALGLVYRGQLPGYKFGFRFFPDFFLPQLGLIIEVDDASHERADKMLEDQERTEYFESRGWRVVRCKNEQALNDPSGTVQSLLADAGITRQDIEAAKKIVLADCMPAPAKAPQKNQRDAAQAKRKVSSELRKRRAAPRRRTPARTRQAASEALPPTQVP